MTSQTMNDFPVPVLPDGITLPNLTFELSIYFLHFFVESGEKLTAPQNLTFLQRPEVFIQIKLELKTSGSLAEIK